MAAPNASPPSSNCPRPPHQIITVCHGCDQFVRRCIKDDADLPAPLVELRHDFFKRAAFQKRLGPAEDAAFQNVKSVLASSPVLHFPDFSREFVVHTDGSEQDAGACTAGQIKC